MPWDVTRAATSILLMWGASSVSVGLFVWITDKCEGWGCLAGTIWGMLAVVPLVEFAFLWAAGLVAPKGGLRLVAYRFATFVLMLSVVQQLVATLVYQNRGEYRVLSAFVKSDFVRASFTAGCLPITAETGFITLTNFTPPIPSGGPPVWSHPLPPPCADTTQSAFFITPFETYPSETPFYLKSVKFFYPPISTGTVLSNESVAPEAAHPLLFAPSDKYTKEALAELLESSKKLGHWSDLLILWGGISFPGVILSLWRVRSVEVTVSNFFEEMLA